MAEYGVKMQGHERIRQKLVEFYAPAQWKRDLEFVGQALIEPIITSTLAGIGEDDQPFAPYSRRYLDLINAVGGKPGGVVNLRGIFYPKWARGKANPRNILKAERRLAALRARSGVFDRAQSRLQGTINRIRRQGGLRQAFTGLAFVAGGSTPGDPAEAQIRGRIRVFQARTQITRPQLGQIDPLSELSADLIRVRVQGFRITLTYRPRRSPHMIAHQEGNAHLPKRKWFTPRKTLVRTTLSKAAELVIKAKVAAFNRQTSTLGIAQGLAQPTPTPPGGPEAQG